MAIVHHIHGRLLLKEQDPVRARVVQLAEEAVRVEREIVKEPGGEQDQYIAAYGGL